MANFCPNCGTAAGAGKFCPSCGKALGGAPAPPNATVAPPAPAQAKTGSSFLKIVLVTLLLVAVVGFAAVVGLVYYAKTRVSARMAELKERTGFDLPAAVKGIQESQATGEKRDGCLLMSKTEAEHILGFALTRSDGSLRAGSQDEHCDYYPDAAALDQIRTKTAERFKAPAQGTSSLENGLAQAEAMTKGMVAGVNDGSAPILQFSVQRGDAKAASFGISAASALMGGKAERLPGPWDEAMFGPMNSTLMMRKGNNGVLIDLRQIPNGREKGLAMARLIAPRL